MSDTWRLFVSYMVFIMTVQPDIIRIYQCKWTQYLLVFVYCATGSLECGDRPELSPPPYTMIYTSLLNKYGTCISIALDMTNNTD